MLALLESNIKVIYHLVGVSHVFAILTSIGDIAVIVGDIVNLDILVNVVIILQLHASAVKRSGSSILTTGLYELSLLEFFPVIIRPQLGIPATLEDVSGLNAGNSYIVVGVIVDNATTIFSALIADEDIVIVAVDGALSSISYNCLASEQEIAVSRYSHGIGHSSHSLGQIVGCLCNCAVGHSALHGDGLDGRLRFNRNGVAINRTALSRLAAINGVVDGGTLSSAIDGHALESLVAASFGIKRRRLDGHDIRLNLERVVIGIDRDVIGTGGHPDGLTVNMVCVEVKGIELIDVTIGQPPCSVHVLAVRNETVRSDITPCAIVVIVCNAFGERNPGHAFIAGVGCYPDSVEAVSAPGHLNIVVGSPATVVHGTQDVERASVVVFQAGFYISSTSAAKGGRTFGMQGKTLIGYRTAGSTPAIGSSSVDSASRINRCADSTSFIITCIVSNSYRSGFNCN